MTGAESKMVWFLPGEGSGLLTLVELGAGLMRSCALSVLRWSCGGLSRVAVPCPELAKVV